MGIDTLVEITSRISNDFEIISKIPTSLFDISSWAGGTAISLESNADKRVELTATISADVNTELFTFQELKTTVHAPGGEATTIKPPKQRV